ncbi:MAG: LysR substrate-binding domain-containing protein, partial [Pseudomonadota bacterium]|nr:LysR substrate-binding domain-containing protein [Pseudomonadota bacterium]
MILREEGSSTRQIIEDALAEAGVAPQVVMEIGSREALHEAVAAGLGIGVVSAAELGTDDRLTVVKISDTRLEAQEFVVCLKERRNVRTVQAFFDLARG